VTLDEQLRTLERHLGRALREDARRAEVHEATARVLLALEDASEAVAMGDLARRMGRDATTATRFVDRAVAEGLMVRRPGSEDRRLRVVELTPLGQVARRALAQAQEARSRALAARLLGGTGLLDGQAEWLLGQVLTALAADAPPDAER
jgi:DNA-binding MarR family transcriptional regulator